MRKHSAITAILTAAVLVAAAWWQLRKDDKPANAVAKRQPSSERFVLPQLPNSQQENEAVRTSEVLVLVPAAGKNNSTNIGVPWNVERAMMGESERRDLREFDHIESQPSPQPIQQLQTDSILGTPPTAPNPK
jgi:hypothetical protein